MLESPVGRRALTRLLITPETVRDHPELLRSFGAYIATDGHRYRLDLTQADLAEACGLTTVHTNRVMRQLREAGLCVFRASVVEINDRRFSGAVRDTVLVPPGHRVVVAFDANNPGLWALHCHLLYHLATGMFTTVRYV